MDTFGDFLSNGLPPDDDRGAILDADSDDFIAFFKERWPEIVTMSLEASRIGDLGRRAIGVCAAFELGPLGREVVKACHDFLVRCFAAGYMAAQEGWLDLPEDAFGDE